MENGYEELKKKIIKKRLQTIASFFKLLVLFGLIFIIPLYVYFTYPEVLDNFKSLEKINSFLLEYKTTSIFIYMGLQVFQIVISILPGQALQFAAGYAYSFWLGYLFSLIGVTLGTVVTFYLARILGKDALHVIFGEEKFSKFVYTLNSKKSYMVLFVIFLIPGIPKDLFTYAAGVSEIKVRPFIIISLIGRSPAMIGSVMMGSMFHSGSYTGLIILAVVATITFIAGILNRDRLIDIIDRFYEKLISKG